jgi:RimJ/RimL family protein N-acetyltransferase/ribosomal protein S18 acetylase RimI-like enzyme
MGLSPVTLEGRHVRLEPLSEDHHDALSEVGLDAELWRWIPTRVTSPEEMSGYIRSALKDQGAGTALPFATIDVGTGRAIGSTRYMNIDMANRRVEIGATWIARPRQRSAVNTEAKFLMLRHAFETLNCVRVELKTDALNLKSRNAILRLGAREEGIFRRHVLTWSGRYRDTVYFSILDSEWPAVKANLESKLERDAPEFPGARRVDVLSASHIEDLHRLYQNEWWTKGRTLEDVRSMLNGTRIVVGFTDPATDRLIAFARVITDSTFKALIFDLIVDSSARDQGLGRKLMDAITSHPALAGVQHFELYCKPELTAFYERWGFRATPADLQFMRRGE